MISGGKPEEIILTRFRLNAMKALPRHIVENARLDAVLNEELNAWVLQLSSWVWSEELATDRKEINIALPGNWWEHFKTTWPKFLKDRFPPRLKMMTMQVDVTNRAIYPRAALALDEDFIIINSIKIVGMEKKDMT